MAEKPDRCGTGPITRYHAAFQARFTYRLLHKKRRMAAATAYFTCLVNPSLQTLEYRMDFQSDRIGRPFSESHSILFSSVYEEIPPQRILLTAYPMLRLKYPASDPDDWHAYIMARMGQAAHKKKLQAVLKDYRLKGVSGQDIDAELRIVEVFEQKERRAFRPNE